MLKKLGAVCLAAVLLLSLVSTALINELVANPDRNIAAALAAKKVQRFLLDNAQVTTVTDAPEKE